MKVGVLLLFFLTFTWGFNSHNTRENKEGTTVADSTQIWLRWVRESNNLDTNQKKKLAQNRQK